MDRTTPNHITKLEPGQIFVFGSNQSGRHGAGAAKTALGWGAIFGQAEGIQGSTYGIPTKDKMISRTLTIEQIGQYVDRFIKYAKNHPEITFLVTKIGCGLAGLKPKNIAPLFIEAQSIKNIWLPERFWHKIKSIDCNTKQE